MRRTVRAAAGKPVLYFPARFDHWAVQPGDGYAAHIGGATGVSTDAQAAWWGGKGIGTVPHALIAACGGDTVEAVRRFADVHYPRVDVVALVDFDNDSVGTSLACARALGERLWGVRLDTSETMVDRSLWPAMGSFRPVGVAPELVREVRRALDAEGFQRGAHRGERGLRCGAHRRASRLRACRWTPTVWAAACCAAPPTSPPTWCSSTGRPCAKVGRVVPPEPAARAGPLRLRPGDLHTVDAYTPDPATAVIVIDMLVGFCRHGNLYSPRYEPLIPRLFAHLKRAEELGAPIVFLADTHTPDDPEFRMFPPHCVAGSGEEEVVPELAEFVRRGTLVRKHTFSGFRGTDLDDVLGPAGADAAWRSPACAPTSACCTPCSTCEMRGYDVVVRRDLVETYDAPGHDAEEFNRFALEHIRDVLGATVE